MKLTRIMIILAILSIGLTIGEPTSWPCSKATSDPNDPSSSQENQGPCSSTSVKPNSEISVSEGILAIEHTLVGYQSLGQNRALRFVYGSLSADPQPIISDLPPLFVSPLKLEFMFKQTVVA